MGLPFLAAFLACQTVLSGGAEPEVPGRSPSPVAVDVVGRVAWGAMAALAAWLFLPESPDFISPSIWLAGGMAALLFVLHVVMKRLVRLRVDQVAAFMWKGVFPATLFWLLMVAALA